MSESYCMFAPGDPWHGPYHDMEYGFPVTDERGLFERLVLEINQAGLSWTTILKKRAGFRRAYEGFDVDTVAAYREEDRNRLLADSGVIRNRRKIDAAIANARRIADMRESHGSFHAWLAAHHPRSHPEWTRLFRQTFVFTGPLIVEEFLMSTGWLPGAHCEDCPVMARIIEARPPWLETAA